jgi:hypothetical protein
MVLGADDATSDVVFAVAISAGGVLIATLIGLWIKYRMKRDGKEPPP